MRDGGDGAQPARIGADYGIACYSGGGFDGLASKHDHKVVQLPVRV
ncbi:hypothetical protein ACLMAL_10355 [Nocardia sp. CWNU-33]